MKFIINSNDFRKSVEKVAVCLSNKSQYVIFRSVNISANAETGIVTLSVANIEQVINIFVKAHIYEGGEVLAEYNVFKRMLNMQGTVTIRSEGKKIIATNGKKICECVTAEWEVDSSYYLMSNITTAENKIATVNVGEMVNVFSNIGKFTDKRNIKPQHCGLLLNTFDNDIVATDGYRLAIYDISEWNVDKQTKIIIPYIAAGQLKKIVGKDNIKGDLYADKKYFCVIADTFTFKTRLTDGEFMDYQAATPTYSPVFINKINITDLMQILKEYKDVSKGNNREAPMGLYFTGNQMYTSIFSKDYGTVDIVDLIEHIEPEEETIIGVDPELLLEVLQLYKSEKLSPAFSYYGSLSPIKMVDGKYTMFILPVRLRDSYDYINKIKKLIA